ncbi:MAG: YgiQ family radical SAM protein [Bacteroidales bacterium]|nr:YgiQ family radical SAM protein [Bacteroidales bacterium]MBR5072667.1 YgiQ family radical SAM protein [Bacteroidales bacterium]
MIPTSVKEVQRLGWDYIDVILFTGDAFVDHPSFGSACISRYLQKFGYRVAVVPQPNWRDDLRDFKKLGTPRLYFGVNSGAMDSMVNHYTAGKRLRHDDAYTPDGKFGQRPDYAVTVYSRILKDLFPEVPVVIGGIEASLRRVTHYDYWKDRLFPSILVDSKADWLCYGMGERPMLELTRAIESGRNLRDIRKIPQLAFFMTGKCKQSDALVLHSFEECCRDKKAFAENFHLIETHANMLHPDTIIEPVGDGYVQINPPYPPATEAEMDSFWDLPFTKLPHPRYKDKRIPAYDMIKFSINTHRGCFGGCNFCTIAAHQGKFIQSRSEESICKEAKGLLSVPGFAGNISDLGAPTANMYGMGGRDKTICAVCKRKSCLFPKPCRNLDRSHARVLGLYDKVMSIKGIKHAYIGSGIRYDLFLDENGFVDDTSYPYLKELILHHTSGRLKVAPEHTEDKVLQYMAKPSFSLFVRLRREFDKITAQAGMKTGIVPYFISSHPGCTMKDMESLSRNPALKGIWMDQVQDFMPTPMTTSSVMYYTGLDPRTMKPVFVERDPERKKAQKSFFFKKK